MLKLQRKSAVLVLVFATGCIGDAALPEVGPCAELPDQALYDYGQIGIGTCLASPSELVVRPDPQDPSNHFVFAVNSNAYSNFSGSSLLAVDASSIDLSCPVNGLHEVESFPLTMHDFAGRLDVDPSRDLGLLSARVNGQFDGDLTDVVFTLDLSDPRDPRFSDRGPRRWGPYRWIQVPADPWSVRINPADGRAWVLGLTNHTISALDLVSDPIRFLDVQGELEVSSADFDDADGSGSAPDFSLISVVPIQLEDEVLTITYQEGTTRLFTARDDAGDGVPRLLASNSGDGVSFVPLAGGPLTQLANPWNAGGVLDAAIGFRGDGIEGLLTGLSEDGVPTLGRMSASSTAVSWNIGANPALEPGDGWDAEGVQSPDWLEDDDVEVWFAGGAGDGEAIGHAVGASFASLERAGDPALPDGDDGVVLAAEAGSWDEGAVFAPAVIGDPVTGDVNVYYTGHDGVPVAGLPGLMSIGLATTADGEVHTRTTAGLGGTSIVLGPGEAGAWDDLAVGWPTVFFDNGRWQMWYRGTDGITWQVGRATSVDGLNWTRDARNPIAGDFEVVVGDDEPLRVYAQKVSPPSGYQISGPITGDLAALAVEGVEYENTVSPLGFLIVGGQTLGRGPAGSYDRDGAASGGRLPGSDLVFYEAVRGGRTTLAVARDVGAGAERLAQVIGADWTGALEGLNGDDPDLALHDPSAANVGADVVVAFSTSSGLALGAVTFDGDVPATLVPRQEGVVLSASADDGFDSAGVLAPSLLVDGHDGQVRLGYEGLRGEVSNIGIATADSVDGSFARSVDPAFPRGAAGAWDDAGVGAPSLLWDADAELYHLWYLGSDGARLRVGHATSPDAATWTRNADADGITQPVFDPTDLAFVDDDGLRALRVVQQDDGRFEMWFEGSLDGVPRVGRAVSLDGVSWSALTNPTTAGDSFTVRTRAGDTDASTGIHLGEPARTNETGENAVFVGGYRVHGAAAAEMVLSPDGRFAVVSNKQFDWIQILDLQDDSTDDWTDANAYGVEAAFRIPQRYGIVGTRDLAFSPDGQVLWTILAPLVATGGDAEARTGTEGLVALDFSQVEDTDEGTLLLDDIVLSWAPLPRGSEDDKGYTADTSVGPSALVLNDAGTRAYVTNFNDNSLWVFDLTTGARPTVIERVTGLDEGPADVVLSPDGTRAYVANYIGQTRNLVVHSTVQVIDVDESSPTFGEVLTTLTNLGSRSDRGCE